MSAKNVAPTEYPVTFWSHDDGAWITSVYLSKERAEKAAESIAKRNPGAKVYVCKALKSYRSEPGPPSVTHMVN